MRPFDGVSDGANIGMFEGSEISVLLESTN